MLARKAKNMISFNEEIRMYRLCNKNSGFTIIEVLISVGIMLVFLPFAASMLTNSQVLASYSKHKIQAAYAAQQIIEIERQQPISFFAPRLAIISPVSSPIIGSVALDTKGNYSNVNCSTNPTLFCGTATVSVAAEHYSGSNSNYTAIYQPGVGAAITYYTIAHVGVTINWTEEVLELKIPMSEYYATDIIVNDAMLN